MTDRERLLKILNVPIHPHENVDPLEAVADFLLDNGVTFQKWIPVSERMPKEHDSIFKKLYGTKNGFPECSARHRTRFLHLLKMKMAQER